MNPTLFEQDYYLGEPPRCLGEAMTSPECERPEDECASSAAGVQLGVG